MYLNSLSLSYRRLPNILNTGSFQCTPRGGEGNAHHTFLRFLTFFNFLVYLDTVVYSTHNSRFRSVFHSDSYLYNWRA